MVEKFKLKDDSKQPNFVRVELLPQDNDIFNHDLKNWKLKVDQDFKPDWFDLDVSEKLMKEKGYNPINQLVGYLLSGDPTYITNYKEARSQIRRVERDELLEELVRYYLKDR